MTPAPSFSIVTPVFNGMPWLPECIGSIRRQSGVEVELIVLDAGSTDGSREWLEANASDATLVFEPDHGQTDALARGFARARGAYLGWLNADDLLEPDALATAASAFGTAETAIVSGCCLLIDTRGAITGVIPTPPSPSRDGLLRHPHNLAQPATFFTADAFRRCGGFDPSLDLAMDVDLWFKLSAQGPVVLLDDTVLARFRVHDDAKSVSRASAAAREDLRVRRRHGLPVRTRAWWVLFKRGYLRPLKRVQGRRSA